MRAKLISVDGERTILLTKDVTVVGRKRGVCDIFLDRTSVSKLHCLIVKTDGLLFVRDLGSTNGTKVNGQKVTRGALLPGDELSFANAKFRVNMGPDDPAANYDEATEVMTSLSNSLSSVEDERLDDPPDEMGSQSDVRLLSDD